MKKKPFTLQNNRLLLRCFQSIDAEGFYQMNLDAETLRYTGDAPFGSITDAATFITNYDHYRLYGYGRWTVIRKEDNAYLGFCGLKYHPDTEEIDLGYRLIRSSWGQGYATEAAQLCLSYGLEQLKIPRIIGRVIAENKASIRVLEKIGMRYSHDFNFEGQLGAIYHAHSDECR